MFKGRSGVLLLLIVVALAVAAFLLLRRTGALPTLFGLRQEEPVIPLDLQTVIPTGWTVQREPQLACNFDDDPDLERLLIYRYDDTFLPPALAEAEDGILVAPFGGVIYDTQADTLPERLESPGPYRSSNLVPYRLLPDFYPKKGQGYLGETGVEVRYWPVINRDACQATEINIFGFSGSGFPTRLSVFRWAGTAVGYEGEHFAGNARVESNILPEGGTQLASVTTYNRLLNHRSGLCEVEGYTRPYTDVLSFDPEPAVRTIDFCFGAPDEPVYPEGVVVALLRGKDPSGGEPPRYLLDSTVLPTELGTLRDPTREPISIITLGNPSFVEPDPVRGEWCTTDQINTADKEALWCGRERVRIETRIVLRNVIREVAWSLVSVVPNRINGDLYWRIDHIEVPPVATP